MNKDRGTIKWTSLMLPEHVQRLRAWENEGNEQPKDKADWELEDLHQTIGQAYNNQTPITLTLYQKGKWQTATGIITTIDVNKRHLLLDTDTIVKAIPLYSLKQDAIEF